MPTLAPDAPSNPTADALHSYRLFAFAIHDAARAAEKVENLPEHYKALAAAIVKLSGLRPHRIVGEAEPDDAKALITDIEAVCLAVDPMVAAFGSYAASHFHGIDKKHFVRVLADNLEGHGLYEIESAGERRAQELREFRSDRRGWSKAHAENVD